MPGASGVDVLKVMRTIDRGVPVIMVTSNADIANLVYMDHMAAAACAQPRAPRA
jgi:FixJ family two-component response regulator